MKVGRLEIYYPGKPLDAARIGHGTTVLLDGKEIAVCNMTLRIAAGEVVKAVIEMPV